MKKTISMALLIWFLRYTGMAVAVSYEASSLHNSVPRRESVQEQFFRRWALIEENAWNFDIYGKLDWVPGFSIYSRNRQTGEKEAVDMRLFRTCGGFTYLRQFGEENDRGSDLMLGFTTAGYHYGLTRQAEIDRGSAGSDSVTDYKYTQFFDDIFALSLVWRPLRYLHGGIRINNQIEPRDNGTMSYLDSSGISRRWFIASNLLTFLGTNFLLRDGRPETIELSLSATNCYAFFTDPLPPLAPEVTLGFKSVKLYNDQPWDAVWVKREKSVTDRRQSAKLLLFSLLVHENINDTLYLDFSSTFQHATERLIEKRTGEKLEMKAMKKTALSAGYNHLNGRQNVKLISTLGYSQYRDEAMPVHSSDRKYMAHGFFYSLGLRLNSSGNEIGTKIYAGYNDAEELEKLIETVDKFSIQWEFNVSFNSWRLK
jgi:hypothetical protein